VRTLGEHEVESCLVVTVPVVGGPMRITLGLRRGHFAEEQMPTLFLLVHFVANQRAVLLSVAVNLQQCSHASVGVVNSCLLHLQTANLQIEMQSHRWRCSERGRRQMA